MLRFFAVFVPLFVTMAANRADNMLTQLGLGESLGLLLLLPALLALLVFEYRTSFLIVAVVVAVVANLPAEAALELGFERDYAIAALLSIILTPRIVEQLDA